MSGSSLHCGALFALPPRLILLDSTRRPAGRFMRKLGMQRRARLAQSSASAAAHLIVARVLVLDP